MIVPTASVGAHDGREGCQAMDPLQPKCSYTVTHTSETPITGVGGIGDWVVEIERGRKTIRIESPANGQLWMLEIAFKVGDK